MNAILFGAAVRERLNNAADEPRPDASLDSAWLVLEAANDLRDDVTVEICRRVIDAGLNGRPASPTDLHIIQHYFS